LTAVAVPLLGAARDDVRRPEPVRSPDLAELGDACPSTRQAATRQAATRQAATWQAAAWQTGRPQPALRALADRGEFGGRVLEVCCGSGEHALLAAFLGRRSIGIDADHAAIDRARIVSVARGVRADFVSGDVLDLVTGGARFDTVLFCGPLGRLDGSVADSTGLAAVTAPGAHLHLLCFSERVPGRPELQPASREQIASRFDREWEVDAIEPATIELAGRTLPVPAWLAGMTRRQPAPPAPAVDRRSCVQTVTP
jgi:SAM-dependent methyltransferase